MTEFEAEALQQLQQINDTLKRLEDLAQWLAERIKQREADERKAAETLSRLL